MPDGTLADRIGRAHRATEVAITRLSGIGVRAELIGSLARGTFGLHSDVDLLVDWNQDQSLEVFGICSDTFGDIEFDLVRVQGLDPDLLDQMRREAVSAVPFASVPRRMATLARTVADMREAMEAPSDEWEAVYARMDTGLRGFALSSRITRHAEVAVDRMVKVLRRLLVDGGHDVPHGRDWEEETIRTALTGLADLPVLDGADTERLLSLWERVHEMALLCHSPKEARVFADEVVHVHDALVRGVENHLEALAPNHVAARTVGP